MAKIPMPPQLKGSPIEQLRQIWLYLYKLAEQLNREE